MKGEINADCQIVIEDATIMEKLRSIGVDYAQGYFVAKPEALQKTADTVPAVLEPV